MWIAVVLSTVTSTFGNAQDYGTAAIAISQPGKYVVLAADSRVNHGRESLIPDTRCKIRVHGKFAFVVAGVHGRPGGEFDVRESLNQASIESDSLGEFFRMAEAEIVAKFERAYADFLRTNAEHANRPLPLQYGVAFRGSDGPSFMMRGLEYRDGRAHPVGDTEADGKDRTRISMMGENDHMGEEVARRGGSAQQLARAAIQREILMHPSTVGPPVTVLTIDAQGVRWDEPGACSLSSLQTWMP